MTTSRRVHCFFLAGLLLFGAGCTRTLRNADVVALRATVTGGEVACPGDERAVVVEAELAGGDVVRTRGAAGGRLPFNELSLRGRGILVTNERRGRVQVLPDPRAHYAGPAELWVRAVHRPNDVAHVKLPVVYACGYVSTHDGADGRDGRDGSDGRGGTRLSDEESDRRRRGSDGANGEHGSSGGAAPSVEVFATLAHVPGSAAPMLQVVVRSSGIQDVFLVDPRGGTVTITAAGGRGGHGGRGGRGGRGRYSGREGWGGDGGHGGPGGAITWILDPSVSPYAHLFRFDNAGGAAGLGGQLGDGGSDRRAGVPGIAGPDGPDVVRRVQPLGRLF